MNFKILFLCSVLFVISNTARAQLQMPSVSNDGLEAQVRSLFADAPDMVAIAKCESSFRQFNSAGDVLVGGTGRNIGIFQFNEPSHASFAQSLGFDIYSAEGNMQYAKYVYEKQGTKPWVSCLPNNSTAQSNASPPVNASPIVNPSLAVLVPASTTPATIPVNTTLASNLKFGMVSPQVATLQKLLNAAGFSVAVTGPGSPGSETTRFGEMTRQALKNFQCSKNIVCDGNESATGFGYLGPRTRQALLATQGQ